MGIFDRFKHQAKGSKAKDMSDAAERKANEKTGHKHADKVAKGKEQLKKGLDSLDGKNDDFGTPPGRPRP